MMNYETITVEGFLGRPDEYFIVITHEDESQESFPVDDTNPRYIQFLEEQTNG